MEVDEKPELRVCNFCGGSGLEVLPDWMKVGFHVSMGWSVPVGLMVPPGMQLCYGCHGRKLVPDCKWCRAGSESVSCGSCGIGFKLSPMCMSMLTPLVPSHIKRGMGSHFVQYDGRYVDFCCSACKDNWRARERGANVSA